MTCLPFIEAPLFLLRKTELCALPAVVAPVTEERGRSAQQQVSKSQIASAILQDIPVFEVGLQFCCQPASVLFSLGPDHFFKERLCRGVRTGNEQAKGLDTTRCSRYIPNICFLKKVNTTVKVSHVIWSKWNLSINTPLEAN